MEEDKVVCPRCEGSGLFQYRYQRLDSVYLGGGPYERIDYGHVPAASSGGAQHDLSDGAGGSPGRYPRGGLRRNECRPDERIVAGGAWSRRTFDDSLDCNVYQEDYPFDQLRGCP